MGSLDMELITELRELMEDEFNSLVEIYLHDSVDRMKQIEAAVAEGDAMQIRHTAHSLKGSSSNIGAVELSAMCQHLEEMGRNAQLDNCLSQTRVIRTELQRVRDELESLISTA